MPGIPSLKALEKNPDEAGARPFLASMGIYVFKYDWLEKLLAQDPTWLDFGREVIPAAIIDKPPSAELRPGQQDSDTLPPYEVLDNILEDYVEDYRTAEQIAHDRGYEVKLVRDVIRMIERSEYKRQQAAPGLKITPKAFGLGRRFPIAQKSEV